MTFPYTKLILDEILAARVAVGSDGPTRLVVAESQITQDEYAKITSHSYEDMLNRNIQGVSVR